MSVQHYPRNIIIECNIVGLVLTLHVGQCWLMLKGVRSGLIFIFNILHEWVTLYA